MINFRSDQNSRVATFVPPQLFPMPIFILIKGADVSHKHWISISSNLYIINLDFRLCGATVGIFFRWFVYMICLIWFRLSFFCRLVIIMVCFPDPKQSWQRSNQDTRNIGRDMGFYLRFKQDLLAISSFFLCRSFIACGWVSGKCSVNILICF